MEFGGTDRFSVIRRLGEGGMGVVYLARDRERDGVVALKTLPMPDPSKILRLKSEFRTLAGISHANLIQLYELVSDGNDWFFTMEYVAGLDFIHHVVGAQISDLASTMSAVASPSGQPPIVHDLATLPISKSDQLQADRHAITNVERIPFKIDESRLRPALRQLVGAIQSLHLAGILHLDVKPSNVLITPSGRVVVLDFGLATRLDGREHDAPEQSVTMRGTPAYMAPEQIGEGMGAPSDWYGVGVLLYEALTRRLPFQGTMWEILHQKMEHSPPPPSTFNPLVPADLDDLCVALLRPRPTDRITGPELAERIGIASSPGARPRMGPLGVHAARSLIGRDREARELRDAFAEVRAGVPITMLVHGTSGVGKTALVERFLGELGPDVRVLRSRCYERESVPYKAFDSLLDVMCNELLALPTDRVAALLPPQTAALVRLFPVLAQVPAIEARLQQDRVVPDALERRRRGFAGLRELLCRLAAERPLVIVLDDLQWADLDSRALLADILRPPSAPQFLLLGCYRDEDAARSAFLRSILAATPAEVGTVREIAVGPLSDGEVRELALVGIAATDRDRAAKAELVVRESGGHPYFVAELVLELAASESHDGALSLDALIDRRVQRLPDLARELLEVVAIAGRPVSQTLLLSAQRSGAVADRLAEEGALAQLQASNMIRTSGARAEDQVEAYHDRVRETVASHLSVRLQRSVHHKLALALESSGAGADELAPHFHAAGDKDKAGHYAARAAETAEQALAFDRAATFLRMAIECSAETSPAVAQPWKERLAEALKNAGRAADAAAAYLHAAETAPIEIALELRRRAAEQLLVSGHLDEGSELLGGVLRAVGLRLARSPNAALASVIAHRLFLKLRGLRYTVRPSGTLREQDLTRIDMCWSVAVGLSMVDNVRAADFQARHLLLSLRSGDLERITRAFTFEVGFVSGPGSAAEAASRTLLRQAGELAERVGTPYATGFHTLMAGVREYLAGRWSSAFELVETAEQTLRERCSGLTWEVTNAQRFALGSLMYKGDLLEVLRRLPGLLRHANDRGNLYVATDLRTRIALPWLAIDDPARVEHEVKDAFARWTDQGFHLQHFNSLMALGHKDLYTDAPELARKRLAQQARRLARSRVLRLQVPRIEVLHLRARLALAMAARTRGSEARALVHDAARDAAAIAEERAPWAVPLAALIEATIRAARRDDAAVDLAENAARQLAAADMHLHAAVARFRVGELVGGDRGAALLDGARAAMVERGVRVPERFVAMFAPGPWAGAQ